MANIFSSDSPQPNPDTNPNIETETKVEGKLTCNGVVDGTEMILLSSNKKISLDADGNFNLSQSDFGKDTEEIEFKLQKNNHTSKTIKRKIINNTRRGFNVQSRHWWFGEREMKQT